MARKRQRAKDRKQKLHRENIPGSLDHASGEVEEVEAAIVAGARGEPVDPLPDDVAAEPDDAADALVQPDDEPLDPDDLVEPDDDPLDPDDVVEPDDELLVDERVEALEPIDDVELVDDAEPVEDLDDDVEDEPYDDAPASDNADAATVERGRLGQGAGDVAVTPNAKQPAGFRVINFFRACWAELQRVDWPDRRQVGQATAVVLGFVVVAGAFLGLADVVAQRIVDMII
jgi:preprotein translocase SecE subunit